MKNGKICIRWKLAVLVIAAIALLAFAGMQRLRIDSDILQAMPVSVPALADAKSALESSSLMGSMVIELSCESCEDMDTLADAGDSASEMMRESGLFESVGLDLEEETFLHLVDEFADNLPGLFDRQSLESQVTARLEQSAISKRLRKISESLSGFGGFAHSRNLATDPLGLNEIVLERLQKLSPVAVGRIYRGHLFDERGSALLVPARITGSQTNNIHSLRVEQLVKLIEKKIHEANPEIKLVSQGAYRASLDNERIARADTKRVVLWATIGIALLLLFSFFRGPIGLLSLLPAFAGTCASLFAISFFRESISLFALGMGGAVIAITVDQGIAFFLFLDRDKPSEGKFAAKEVWSIGLLATLTTAGAFLSLTLSDFPFLHEVGLFAGLGVLFSFSFVHAVLPHIFVEIPAAKPRFLPLAFFPRFIASRCGWPGFFIVLIIAIIMGLIAKPEFQADITAMNTVSTDTLSAEAHITKNWGDFQNRAAVLIQAQNMNDMLDQSNTLGLLLRQEQQIGRLSASFVLADVFPGESRLHSNLNDWRNFWDDSRIERLERDLAVASAEYGFAANAFRPFIDTIRKPSLKPVGIPASMFEALGITQIEDRFTQTTLLATTQKYDAGILHSRLKELPWGLLLDGRWYADLLSSLLRDTFFRMLAIVGFGVTLLILFFFMDLTLLALALLPIVFSFSCTLGTLTILDHPIDMPGMILAIVVFGMGIDYALFFIRAHQRHFDEHHPSIGAIRTAVFLSASSTLIGFVSLAFADHNLLSSLGIALSLGIGYALIASFILLPPLLRLLYRSSDDNSTMPPSSRDHHRLIARRYRHIEASARCFAFWKSRLDPMFPKLASRFEPGNRVLDVGCGYALPSVWLCTCVAGLHITAVEPNPERLRIARRVLSNHGTAYSGTSTNLPDFKENFDKILFLDVIHYLSDKELESSLSTFRQKLANNGKLILRSTVSGNRAHAWERIIESFKMRLKGKHAIFRDAEKIENAIAKAGFTLDMTESEKSGRSETWFIASLPESGAAS